MIFYIDLNSVYYEVGKAAVFFSSYLLKKLFEIRFNSKCHYFFHVLLISKLKKDVNVLDISIMIDIICIYNRYPKSQ